MQTKIEDVAGLKKRWEVEGVDFDDVAAFSRAYDTPRSLSRAIQSLITEDQPRNVRFALEIAKRCLCPCCGNCFYHSDKRYYAKKLKIGEGKKYTVVAEYRCANKESELRGKVTKNFVTCEHWRCEKLFWRGFIPAKGKERIILYWEDKEQPYPRRKRAFENGEDNGEYFIASEDDLPLY